MQTYNIKAALVTEANKAASFSRIKIPGQHISLEVEQFLEKIAAPKDLQGFYYVAQSLASLLQQTDNALKKALQLSDYLSAALLIDGELYLSKAEVATYKKTTAGSYWAKESPLYLLLFGASGFKKSTEDKLFLTAFIKHFIQSKKMLEDPSIQPKEHTRSEEVCRAFRWLQHKNSPSFNVKLFSSSIQNWSPGEIASAIDGFLVGARFGKATIRYSRTLYKFFANDWSNIRLKGANGPQKTPRSGGGRRVTTKPEVESVSKTLVPTVVVTNEEGVDTQDTEILRTHIANTIESENERAKYERNSIGAIFDEELQKIGSIDITKALRQKNNLILSSRLLLSRGSLQLLKSLFERRLSKTDRHDAAFAICCMLSTGISLPELSKLKIYRNIQGSENGIAVIKGQVFWQFKHLSSALRPAGQPEYFYGSDDWVYTPCSIVVSNYIQNNSFEHDSCLFEIPELQLRIKIDKLLQRMSENLKTMNISISMIESFLQRFVDASDTVDPVVLDFSYQQEIYATRVSRSYVNISNSERLSMLNQLWRDIADYAGNESIANYFQPTPANTHDAERRTGSCYVPSSTFCRDFVQSLQKNISLHNPTRALKLKDIIEYHNAYTRYVAWMLAFATGYRAVFNPLPALALHIDALQILSISDKDDASFSHSRVVAVAPVLSTQLNFLESHLIRLSELLTIFCPRLFHSVQELLTTEQKLKLMTAEQTKKWFLQQRNSRTRHGPLFYLNDTLESFPVSPAWLSENNGEYLRVPANMGRHWLKTALLVTGLPPELVNWQMGHWQEGQSPLFENSTLSVGDSAKELALVIDKLLTEQGWLAWKSALI